MSIFDHPKLDFLPESVIQLQIEVQKYHSWMFKKHPKLASFWGTPEMIGTVASEVGVVLDDLYNDKDVDRICELLRTRLVARRTPKEDQNLILLPPNLTRQ